MGQKTQPSRETYLTTSDVAEILRVSDQNVRGMIKRGELPAFKRGRDWLISRSKLDEYINQQSESNTARLRSDLDIE